MCSSWTRRASHATSPAEEASRDGRCGTCPATSSRLPSSTSSITSYCVLDIAVRSRVCEHNAAYTHDAAAPGSTSTSRSKPLHRAPTPRRSAGSTSSSSMTAGAQAIIGGAQVYASYLVGADGANGVVARAAGLGEGIVRGVALEGNVPGGLSTRSRTGRPPGSSSESFQAGTGGSSRRATTRTWGLAAGSSKGPIFELISIASHESTASTRPRSRRCAGTVSRCAGSDLRPRTGAFCWSAMPQVSWIHFR